MHDVQPILIDCGLQRVLRTRADYALIFGDEHADALEKLLNEARRHGQDVYVAVLDDGRKETLVARVAGSAGDWRCIR
ncbi:hypothetical protein G3N95_36125 [Paraburkholderia sp. Tr-20389]|uniref:hypothetical protein n=1 Tax=Paraburkholderia sp. Tr-20389 TaxID=2703903 RepID=UPI0019804FB0|nr:hypothetical protein [Paraburkholderia sp. Tr-20389]MBN3758384.1 hypothetical protein [Paraburkholderia sp. Tr-20389]